MMLATLTIILSWMPLTTDYLGPHPELLLGCWSDACLELGPYQFYVDDRFVPAPGEALQPTSLTPGDYRYTED